MINAKCMNLVCYPRGLYTNQSMAINHKTQNEVLVAAFSAFCDCSSPIEMISI